MVRFTKKKKLYATASIAAISLLIFGAVKMNLPEQKNDLKVINGITDETGAYKNYTDFINESATKKKLNEIEKKNLLSFMEENIKILSGDVSVDDIEKHNENIVVKYSVPKLSLAPVTGAFLDYTFIIKPPSMGSKGVAGSYLGHIERADEKSPWEYADISMMDANDVTIYTNFTSADVETLKLKPEKRFFRDDLASGAEAINFSTRRDYKKFVNSNDNGANYAYYRYSTVRNGVKVSVVFGVKKAQYDEAAAVPSNWFYVYMKREG
ncbi:hypothetical protein AAFM71_07470 [Chromobacterium violaceum]|uniref:hypothetical protein n=1 Tax=Chromobacterium violaceum TaxID=536 RepID=UPI00385D16BA